MWVMSADQRTSDSETLFSDLRERVIGAIEADTSCLGKPRLFSR
jgi:hypothetical protein